MIRTALLMTGSEIMSGDILDTNAPFLAQSLKDIGLQLNEKVSVGDNVNDLTQAISRLCNNNQLLIINGGLGPTSDDLTAAVLSQVANTELAINRDAKQHVENWCAKRKFEVTESQLKQCLLPKTAEIFKDSPGSACGFYMTIGECLVMATPGVPSELKQISQVVILPLIQQTFNFEATAAWQRYQLFGIGETRIQATIDEVASNLVEHFEIGYRAQLSQVELKLRPLQTNSNNKNTALAATLKANCLEQLSDYIFAEGDGTLASAVATALQEQELTLGLAESCTGGLIAKEITALAGASEYFNGGIVCYSNAVKHKLLNVPQATLDQHGAVSEPTALAMLAGCLQAIDCDVAIAVTGIAGPSGGSKDKSVGTVFIAFGSLSQPRCIELCIPFERTAFQIMTCAIALDSLRRFILGQEDNAGYLSRYAVNRSTSASIEK